MKDYTQYFVKGIRTNGEKYTYLENAPVELQDLVRSIHYDHFYRCFPNDWIYEQIFYALQSLEADDLEDINIEADAYNSDLAKWFYDNCNQYANELTAEVIEEFGADHKSAIDLLMLAQHEAINRIYQSVNDFLKEVKDA